MQSFSNNISVIVILLLAACGRYAIAFSATTTTAQQQRLTFQGLQDNQFRHPLDRDLTALVRATPGASLAETAFRRAFPLVEEGARLDLLASSVRVSDKQLPNLHKLLLEACKVLEISSTPELYVQSNSQANAFTTAFQGNTPVIVVTSALLDRCSDREIQAIIGHELGHLKCEHSFYLTMGGIASAPLRILLPFVGNSVVDSLLQEWRLAAEYSCDRAAVLVAQDIDVVASAMLKLFSGTSKYDVNAEAFVAQADEYDELLQSASPAVRASVRNQQRTHPLPVRRVAELKRWSKSNKYLNLLKNSGVAI